MNWKNDLKDIPKILQILDLQPVEKPVYVTRTAFNPHWCSSTVDLVQGQDGGIRATIRHVLQLETTDEVMKSFSEYHLLYY